MSRHELARLGQTHFPRTGVNRCRCRARGTLAFQRTVVLISAETRC